MAQLQKKNSESEGGNIWGIHSEALKNYWEENKNKIKKLILKYGRKNYKE